MSSEKRLFLCLVLTIGSVYGMQMLMVRTGLIVPPRPKPAPAVAKADPAGAREKSPEKEKADGADRPAIVAARGELPADPFTPDRPAAPAEPAAPAGPAIVPPAELVLGAPMDAGAESPYHLRLQLSQRGAAVDTAASTRFEAELDPSSKGRKRERLELITRNSRSAAPGSLAIVLTSSARGERPPAAAEPDAEADPEAIPGRLEAPLDRRVWEVVRPSDGTPAVKSLSRVDPATKARVEGQEIAFRTSPKEMPGLVVTKVFRIWQGQDGFEVDLKFDSPSAETRFAYRLYGPHGIPVEGEWYTSTFRDAFFGQVNGAATAITTQPSHDVVKYQADPTQRISALPLKFAGVEDQYFATFVEPSPIPRSQDDRRDIDAGAIVIKEEKAEPQKSDIGVELVSKPILAGPNLGEVVHSYRVFAGPKTASALAPYEAEELASYRKTWLTIPGASWMAKNLISPLLDRIYALTESVSRAFGGTKGNYGVAIILLTMTVRLIMFPIGRKQAMMAKKMQDLQPILAEVKEKYKDDKEALTRETMAVWKRNNVNPAAGCLPALIQLPIFTGLWQTLNNSVALRHSTFLYIRDLAAPDVLFQFPYGVELPFVGRYFNLLPILVVSLMLVQTRLFAPPPTTPEAEMNQKMMKYMMVVMAVMFYKVPSGLGLYFITGSLWQIGERLLLPKMVGTPAKVAGDDDPFGDKGRGPGGGGGNGRGGSGGDAPGGNRVQGWLGKRLEKLLEEASKDKTIRNDDRNPGRGGDGRERDRGADRDRARPRSKPPGKRR